MKNANSFNYKCDICYKEFIQKIDFTRHINRKKPCIRPIPNNTETIQDNTENSNKNTTSLSKKCCCYCNTVFSQKSALNRHIKSNCKVKQQRENEKEDIFKRLVTEINEIKKENNELRKEMAKISNAKSISCSKIQNNMINSNNVVGNTFVLIGCGQEDMSKIDKNDIIRSIKCGYHTPLKLTEAVHFNPKYPEYHNVYISNMKDKYAMIYDGNNWNLTTKNELVDRLYDGNKSYVEENLDDFCLSLHAIQRNALDRWLNTDDDNEKIKDIKERIKMLLYNKRNIPLQTKDANPVDLLTNKN